MQEIHKRAETLLASVKDAADKLDVAGLRQRLEMLTSQSQSPDFWSDTQAAQSVMKEIASLQTRVDPWQKLMRSAGEVAELSQMGDDAMQAELEQQLRSAEHDYEQLKGQLLLGGPYDTHNALLSIYAGAGGTDAQDWAQMLLRMYQRYAEKAGYKIQTLDETPGEEAGLKSITLQIEGPFAYGHLKGEHGVHRLVRLSPFNADNLRQTSFAKVEVMPVIDSPEEVAIDDKDVRIDVYRSGGHGGQSVNTTDSAVRITHIPTGIAVAIQNERSQLQNKETAMTIIRSRLAQLQLEQHQEQLSELKGPNQSAEWGNQIRSYVLHPYKQVKDLRTRYETSDTDAVLDGGLDQFVQAYLEHTLGR
jgi:peptide chain release factor 2